MKRVFIGFLAFLFSTTTQGQPDSLYQTFIAEAGLFHLQKDHKNAIICFEKAFKLRQPTALNAYKAAGVYSLDRKVDKAFAYLELALELGWTEADWLAFDPYFDYLRKKEPEKWNAIEQKAHIIERQFVKTLQFPSLRKEINLMTLRDQQLRYKRVQTYDDSLLSLIDQQITQSDFNNLKRAKEIIQQHDWLKISQIGKDGQNNLWLIVQHADQDVLFQQTALAAMEKLKESGEINLENYAFLYDRVQCNLNYKQLYGTQVIGANQGKASGFRPIKDEDKVDVRRKEIGLQPMQIYALTYGFNYKIPTTAQARQRDSAENENLHLLLDVSTRPTTCCFYNFVDTGPGYFCG